MTKRITFIGPNFAEHVSKGWTLKMSFLENLWTSYKELDSEEKCRALVQQLKLIEKQEISQHKNEQLSVLIQQINQVFYSPSVQDVNERLLIFKRIVQQSMLVQVAQIEKESRTLLGYCLAGNEYIFSYSFDFFVENLIRPEHELVVCTDRQSFLRSGNTADIPVLYKLYGSFNQVESIAITREEKNERIINLRLAISKITQLEEVTISLIGFEKEDTELKELLNELATRNRTDKISFVKVNNESEEIKKHHYLDSQTGLTIDVITASLKNYFFEQQGMEHKQKYHFGTPQVKDSALQQNEKQEKDLFEDIAVSDKSRKEKEHDKDNQQKNKTLKIPYKAVCSFVGLAVCAVGFNFFFSVATIKGESMAPTFSSSDYIVVNKQHSQVNRFDVIAFNSPDESGQEYIKRVIGLPGDVIEYIDDQLYINGNVIEESYLDREKKKLAEGEIFTKDFSLGDLAGVKEVPKDKLFVLGDNRLYSRDSRNFGFIDVKEIKGNVKWKLWPIKGGVD